MTEAEILKRWEAERDMYCAWGAIVEKRVIADLKADKPGTSMAHFLRLSTKPRAKSSSSLVEKALHRGKPYDNPYEAVTDKVGVRFVVLLTSEIKIVEKVVEECPLWDASKDKDFIDEQEQNPIHFAYSAMHYIVRNREEIADGGIIIPPKTPCEIQIKTILQHAYSELTHDTIYKPMVDATPGMKRSAAKSMALIEATNDYFEEVTKHVEESLRDIRALSEGLGVLYLEFVGQEAEVTRAEAIILNAFLPKFGQGVLERVREFLTTTRPFVAEKIREKASQRLLYRQPSILLVYYLTFMNRTDTVTTWPLTPDELHPVYTDLGFKFEA